METQAPYGNKSVGEQIAELKAQIEQMQIMVDILHQTASLIGYEKESFQNADCSISADRNKQHHEKYYEWAKEKLKNYPQNKEEE